jgi:hypothetical protein
MTATDATLHDTSLAVWDIPTPAAGERFSVKAGAKSSAGCALGGCRIEVLEGDTVVASGSLGDAPWPGTSALYWAEVELRAPQTPGTVTFSVRLHAGDLDEPHQSAAQPFNVSVVARPDHTLTGDGRFGRRADRGGLYSPRALSRHHRRIGAGLDQIGGGPL